MFIFLVYARVSQARTKSGAKVQKKNDICKHMPFFFTKIVLFFAYFLQFPSQLMYL